MVSSTVWRSTPAKVTWHRESPVTWDRAKLEADREFKAQRLSGDAALRDSGLNFLTHSYEFDYCYLWDWAGMPILQMPEDIVACQEILMSCRPNVVIETGVAWGGGLALVATMMSLYEPNGTVLGIDLNLNPELSEQFEQLDLPVTIELLEASSTDQSALTWVDAHIAPTDRVMVTRASRISQRRPLGSDRGAQQTTLTPHWRSSSPALMSSSGTPTQTGRC